MTTMDFKKPIVVVVSPLTGSIKKLIAYLLLFFFVNLFISFIYSLSMPKIQQILQFYNQDINFDDGKELLCQFKTPPPLHFSIQKFIFEPLKLNCSHSKYPEIFKTDGNLLIMTRPLGAFGYAKCCYKVVNRDEMTDSNFFFSKVCFPVAEKTKIPSTHEFIAIFCSTSLKYSNYNHFIDMKWFVNLKRPAIAKKIKLFEASDANEIDEDQLNIIILGLDGVSNTNFFRHMNQTIGYLKEKMDPVFFSIFNKVDDNTFPNIVPVLTGLDVKELKRNCWFSKGTFDNCPFIWKDYSNAGYLTSFSEDAPSIAIFNYLKKGFSQPPTDFYLRPLTSVMSTSIGHNSERCDDQFKNKSTPPENDNCIRDEPICYGHRFGFEILLENIKITRESMKDRKYFHFTWATSLFHDFLNDVSYGDQFLHEMFRYLYVKDLLNNSIFILMSDHGIRYGDIRATIQGKMEERNPILSFILPTWFKKKYSLATKNLVKNSQRLVTPFDLHETLKDLLQVRSNMANQMIYEKSIKLFKSRHHRLPSGISLFLPVPLDRTCPDAKINLHFCLCNSMKTIQVQPVLKHVQVQIGSDKIVDKINLLLSRSTSMNVCARLSLASITSAKVMKKDLKSDIGDIYEISLVTIPGNGHFEASVTHYNYTFFNVWEVSDSISRINLYGNQSWCVDDSDLKIFCLCI